MKNTWVKQKNCTCVAAIAGTAGSLVVRRLGVFVALCRTEITHSLYAGRTLHYCYHDDR